ncbi:MAG: lysophospholipid acyltransferase family protein [bacterium]|jgi:KDO2-lipid IV(A) lauroyltransferase
MLHLILKGLTHFFAWLSLPGALTLGRGLGWFFGSVLRHRRKDASEALRRSFPEKTEQERNAIIDRMYQNLGMNLIEEFRLPSVTKTYLEENILWENEAYSHNVLTAGKGLLVLSAHLGNFDLLCTFAPKFNFPTTVITKSIKNVTLNKFWMDARSRFGLKFVPAHNSYRQCLSALRKNEIVAFVLDQNMIDTEGVFVDFFGKKACTSPGLAYMSAQSGAAVVPVFMIRLDNGRHLIKAFPAIPPPPDRKPETIHVFTQLYTKIIEDVIREYPDQWTWIHRRWKTTPKAAFATPSSNDQEKQEQPVRF